MRGLKVYNTEALQDLPNKFVGGGIMLLSGFFVPQYAPSHHIFHYPLVSVFMQICKFHVTQVNSGHVHFGANLRNDLKMKLIHTPTPLILPEATLRLLFFGVIVCTDCPTLNCTYILFTKQSMAYLIQYKYVIDNVSAIRTSCGTNQFFRCPPM